MEDISHRAKPHHQHSQLLSFYRQRSIFSQASQAIAPPQRLHRQVKPRVVPPPDESRQQAAHAASDSGAPRLSPWSRTPPRPRPYTASRRHRHRHPYSDGDRERLASPPDQRHSPAERRKTHRGGRYRKKQPPGRAIPQLSADAESRSVPARRARAAEPRAPHLRCATQSPMLAAAKRAARAGDQRATAAAEN